MGVRVGMYKMGPYVRAQKEGEGKVLLLRKVLSTYVRKLLCMKEAYTMCTTNRISPLVSERDF